MGQFVGRLSQGKRGNFWALYKFEDLSLRKSKIHIVFFVLKLSLFVTTTSVL